MGVMKLYTSPLITTASQPPKVKSFHCYHVCVWHNLYINVSRTCMVMARKRYLNVSIPEDLAKEIDKIIKKSKLGYDSRAGFIMEAVREKIYKEKKV